VHRTPVEYETQIPIDIEMRYHQNMVHDLRKARKLMDLSEKQLRESEMARSLRSRTTQKKRSSTQPSSLVLFPASATMARA
jgi:predicted DNA-binding protein (UPF0278 family)